MSIKTIITDNSLASATIGDKTLTRRTQGDQVIYDGASGGGGGGGGSGGTINRYAVTAGVLTERMGSQTVSSIGTGITVPSGISSVFILGAEFTNSPAYFESVWEGFGAGGASIPRNTGTKYWNAAAYVNLQGGPASAAPVRAYWGMSPNNNGEADNKIYAACTNRFTITSLFLMFI